MGAALRQTQDRALIFPFCSIHINCFLFHFFLHSLFCFLAPGLGFPHSLLLSHWLWTSGFPVPLSKGRTIYCCCALCVMYLFCICRLCRINHKPYHCLLSDLFTLYPLLCAVSLLSEHIALLWWQFSVASCVQEAWKGEILTPSASCLSASHFWREIELHLLIHMSLL